MLTQFNEELRICSIASGSSGNCYLVRTNETAVLVDAGISGKKILEGLENASTFPEEVAALLLTHEHIDHVRSVKVLTKKIPALRTYSTIGTWMAIRMKTGAIDHVAISAGDRFSIGDINVTAFRLSHDAVEPVGYSFEAYGRRVTIMTDSGIVLEDAHRLLARSNLIVLESNHDVETLHFCRYPYMTKRRILGDQGHLSNEACGEELCRILEERSYAAESEQASGDRCGDSDNGSMAQAGRMVALLAHLSKETNFPEMAFQTVRNVLEENGYYVGRDIEIAILDRDKISATYEV